MIFKNDEIGLAVNLDLNFIETLKKESLKFGNLETGGMIFGTYFDNRAVIGEITGPPKDSIHETHGFERGTEGTQELIDKNYAQGMRWIGDWHSHPNNSANPSSIDNAQMIDFSNDESVNCPEPILIIVGGLPYHDFEMSIQVYKDNQKWIMKREMI